MTKILIIEDDNFLANAYRVKLSKAGFDIQIASDGLEGIKALETFTPDLILLDLVMPRLDGFGFLEQIKKDETYKKIPVLITSNLGQKEDIDRGIALGAKDYIIKSDLSLGELAKKIKGLVGG